LSPPTCRRYPRHAWQWLLPVGIVATCAVARAAVDAPRFGMAGGSECLWVYRVGTDTATNKVIASFAIRRASGEDGGFAAVATPGLGGNIAWAVASGDAVHLIFRDGTHRSLRVRETVVMRVGDERVELPLPRNAVPLAMAVDAASRTLHAVVPGAVAAEVPWPQADTTTDAEMTTSAPAEVEAERSASLGLVRYADRRWVRRRDFPPDFAAPRRLWLCVNGEQTAVFFVGEGGGDRLWSLTGAEEEWGAPAPVAGVDGMSVLDVVCCDGETLILSSVSGERKAPPVLQLSRWESGTWVTRELEAIADLGSETVFAGVLGSHLAMGFVGPHASGPALHVGLWSPAGEPVEPVAVVDALLPPTGFRLSNRMRLAGPYAVLTVLLLGVLIRRRRAIAEPAALGERQAIVGVGRRAAAFALDVLITAPLLYPFLQPHLTVLQAQMESTIPADAAAMALSFDLFWNWLAAVGIFTAYCTVFEATVAATPGKRVMRCRVADEQGHPCGFLRVAVRNLLRLVEMFPVFDLLPSLVLILLTRKRQRLGDLLAGTLVIEQGNVGAGQTEDHPAPRSEKDNDARSDS